jgi:hypothetical protein
MLCPACGSEIKEVPAGISKKTGKPYDAFQVCSNKLCGWKPKKNEILVDSHLPTRAPHIEPTNDLKEKSMLMSYAKDIVVAMMQTNSIPTSPVKETIAIYRELLQELKNPNSVDIL